MMSQLFDSLNFFPALMIVSHHILRSKIFPAPVAVMSSARLTWLVVGDVSSVCQEVYWYQTHKTTLLKYHPG